LKVTAINFTGVTNATAYGAQQTGVRPPSPPKDGKDPMTSVAKALGMSTDDLKSALKDGQNMNDLADATGLAHDDLIAAIKAGMPSNVDTSSDDATTTADKIASTNGPPPPGRPSSSVVGNPSKLSELSKLFDLDSTGSDGLSSATNAAQLLSTLQQNGVDLSKLRSVLNSGDLLDTTA
jgi:hypothetical protein